MLVKFKMDVTWSDRSCLQGEVIELGDALCQYFIQRGFVEEVKESKKVIFEPIIEKQSDKDITAHEDSGDSKHPDNGTSKNARKGRTVGRNK